MQDPSIEGCRNLRTTFEVVADHSPAGTAAQFGSVTAVPAGVPTPTFNRVFVLEPYDSSELEAAITWFAIEGIRTG